MRIPFVCLSYCFKRPAIFGVIALCMLSNISFSQQVIQLSDYAGHPKLKAVEVMIDGKKFNFLFDTGAGVTLITPQVLQLLGKASYGEAVGYRMKGEKVTYRHCDSIRMQINDYSIFHHHVGVWDLNEALPNEWPVIDGVISLASFKDKCYTLDLGNNQIVVETESSCEARFENGVPLIATFANGFSGMENSIFIDEKKNGNTYRFLVDSGNLDKVKVSYATCHEWGIKPDSASGRQDVGTLNYSLSEKTVNIPTVVDDIIYDGVYNFDVIANHVLTISHADQRVFIK